MPVRQDVYVDQRDWTDHVNPFEQSHGFNQRNEWMGLFSDMRVVWTAAWIDSHDELKRAHDAVMKVKNGSRREALEKKLAELPMKMSDLVASAAERRRLQQQPGSDLEGWSAKWEIELAQKFRAHYRQIADQAEKVNQESRQNSAVQAGAGKRQ